MHWLAGFITFIMCTNTTKQKRAGMMRARTCPHYPRPTRFKFQTKVQTCMIWLGCYSLNRCLHKSLKSTGSLVRNIQIPKVASADADGIREQTPADPVEGSVGTSTTGTDPDVAAAKDGAAGPERESWWDPRF
jgi:hypothetical protein